MSKRNAALARARKQSGLTQVQVAKAAGISENSYQRYEYGPCPHSVRAAIEIAKTLNSTVEELFGT